MTAPRPLSLDLIVREHTRLFLETPSPPRTSLGTNTVANAMEREIKIAPEILIY